MGSFKYTHTHVERNANTKAYINLASRRRRLIAMTSLRSTPSRGTRPGFIGEHVSRLSQLARNLLKGSRVNHSPHCVRCSSVVIVAKQYIDRRQSYKRARAALLISVHLNVDTFRLFVASDSVRHGNEIG
ncbi:ORF144 [Leucania separata nucleopolyhedrovirus]|uniref:ORF144 n=1 Tax=Leucania separata nucleopolyhedrovirus TaxID=1307956 RepID=Q0IKX5_NPVLS|nr:ORF144 [Leucania separata nucleopolyhedrovirus]AAR28908.1 ORF144 [Leucania separata nucleopolyhedrovirus]